MDRSCHIFLILLPRLARPFGHIYPPVWSYLPARLVIFTLILTNANSGLRPPESELKKKLNFSAVDNSRCPSQQGCRGARCGQGVGPPRARHARRQGAAARGCARVRSRRQAAPPLPSAARRSRRVASGRRASRPIDSRPPARAEQKADREGGWTASDGSPRTLPSSMGCKVAKRACQGGPGRWQVGAPIPELAGASTGRKIGSRRGRCRWTPGRAILVLI